MNKVLELLMFEFGRIKFDNAEHQLKFEDIFNENIEQTPWTIIAKLINLLTSKNIKIVLILDQFKNKTVDGILYQQIEKNLNNNFKLVISFSISDNIDFNNIENYLVKNNNLKSSLTKENQDKFFYYSNLLNRNEIRNLKKNDDKYNIYDLFDFSPKYIHLLKYHNVEFIQTHIIDYLKSHCKEVGISNFNAYLFNFSKCIDREFSFNGLNNIASKIPMKYCYLEFYDNNFKIKCQFKYLDYIIKNNLQLENVKDYFMEKKDKEDTFEKRLKGDFFEALACKTIESNHKIYFNDQIKSTLTVTDILSMGEYDKNDTAEYILENYHNYNNTKKVMKKKNYYDEKIKLLDKELNTLKSSFNENLFDINHFKYKVF